MCEKEEEDECEALRGGGGWGAGGERLGWRVSAGRGSKAWVKACAVDDCSGCRRQEAEAMGDSQGAGSGKQEVVGREAHAVGDEGARGG
jgi:hypothetical protein